MRRGGLNLSVRKGRGVGMRLGVCLGLGVYLGISLVGAIGCGPPDNLSSYDVEVVVFSDCTQIASSAVNCVTESELRAVSRSGLWIVEDLGGANVLNPVSNFVITNDQGRSATGIHFVNNGGLVETNSCLGEGGQCYFGLVRHDTLDVESGCSTVDTQSYDFRVMPDGLLVGLYQEQRLEGFRTECTPDPETGEEVCEPVTDPACGTASIGQRLTEVTGMLREEDVLAREALPGDGDMP